MANLVYVVVALICAVAVTNAIIPVPSNLCKFKRCPPGTVCKETGIVCVTTPCPTTMCVPISPVNLCKFRKCPAGYVCKETGIVCVTRPCPTTECVKKTKPGKCPNVHSWFQIFKHCHLKPKCRYDSDCKGNLKCCGFCPRVCRPPVFTPKPKPGVCPKMSTSSLLCKAKSQCWVDNDCDGIKKCCGMCPRRCVNPLFIWKG